MQSGKGGLLQSKGPTNRDEPPRQEGKSTEKRSGEEGRGLDLPKICKRNWWQSAIFPLKGSRLKLPANYKVGQLLWVVSSTEKHHSCQRDKLSLGAFQLLHSQHQPTSQESTSPLGLAALAVDMYMAHLEYFPQLAAQENVFPRLLIHARWQTWNNLHCDLWKQEGVLFSLKLTGLGQPSGTRAMVPQARSLRPSAEVMLCPAQAQIAFPTTAEVTRHFNTYPGTTRLITLAGSQGQCWRVNCSAGPAQETQGDRYCTLQLLPLILAALGRREVTQTSSRDWKA